MKKALKIGITFDTKENYNIKSDDWKHSDFSTLADITFVKEKIQSKGFDVTLIGDYRNLKQKFLHDELHQFDLVFNTVEGLSSRNREGLVPSFLELNKIAYTGSDAYSVNLALNKTHTNIIAKHLNINTPQFFLINNKNEIYLALDYVNGPWILKPNYEGSSSGVHIANTENELFEVASELLKTYNQPILCEQYIAGREIVISQILDNEKAHIVGAAEIVRKNGQPIGIYNSKDKFSDSCKKIPVNLSSTTLNKLYSDSLKLHKFLGCYDYSRTDFRVDENNNIYFLEITPLPSIGPNSGFAKCCEFGGYDFADILEQIILNAYCRAN